MLHLMLLVAVFPRIPCELHLRHLRVKETPAISVWPPENEAQVTQASALSSDNQVASSNASSTANTTASSPSESAASTASSSSTAAPPGGSSSSSQAAAAQPAQPQPAPPASSPIPSSESQQSLPRPPAPPNNNFAAPPASNILAPPTPLQPCEKAGSAAPPTAPIQGIPTFGDMFENAAKSAPSIPTNHSDCNITCAPMNNSAILDKLQNVAHLSAGAAQAALDAVGNKSATPTAVAAERLGQQGITINAAIRNDLVAARQEADYALHRLKVLREANRKAAFGYSTAISTQREMPPVIPSVGHMMS
eukprot:CAMPEP_0169125950 /NCGR_PEP_ID=MMETSP1015-20121227/35172_1 /TAXON_ID=342587 /ORGANISM="Karlodinium micrum, Strain CCMP2283" /LENGTH=306 /DNA_ID=CAMNT_0009189549 /DNA_START=96 /DNA_END=1016 /DNA_ORIENTATION=+